MDAKFVEIKNFELDKEHEALAPEEFLYNRRGPWPQPSPNHPLGEVPGVLHIPFIEWISWWLKIGSRYMRTWFLWWPVALFKALRIGSLKELSDDKFSDIFYKTCYAKYICTEVSDYNKVLFKDYIKEGKTYYIIDFTGMDVVRPDKGLACEKTITLLEFSNDKITPIAINLRDYVCDPNDKDLWELAKYMVMVGASVHINVCEHPKLHFPMDAINAVTKTALPKDHILFQLIHPQLEMTLKLDYQVLNSPMSLLQNKKWMIYSPFGQTMESLRDLMVIGYCGLKGNPAYNKYEYPLEGPRYVPGDFGKYHQKYYQVFYKFAKNVVSQIPEGDKFVTRWANYINHQMPSFPNGVEIWQNDNFAKAVGVLLWDLSVGHAVDHKTYSEIPISLNPIRFRVSSPKTKDAEFKFNRKNGSTVIDMMKWIMASRMFYQPWNVANLTDISYAFKDKKLQEYVTSFRNDLDKTEEGLDCINFMKVKDMPSSIQY